MPFQMKKQIEDQWCWAAVSMSVDHYFSPSSTLSQCLIAREVLRPRACCADPDACNTPARLRDALQAIRRPFEVRRGPLSFDEVRTQIDAQLPVCVRIGWSRGGGHFVVISGYHVSPSGAKFVKVEDPLFPSSIVPYDVLVFSYQNAQDRAGGGQWTTTFLLGA